MANLFYNFNRIDGFCGVRIKKYLLPKMLVAKKFVLTTVHLSNSDALLSCYLKPLKLTTEMEE